LYLSFFIQQSKLYYKHLKAFLRVLLFLQFCEIILKKVFLLLDQLEFLLYFDSTFGIRALVVKSLEIPSMLCGCSFD